MAKRHLIRTAALVCFLWGGGLSCRGALRSDLPVVTLRAGGAVVHAEVADQEATRDSGLMFRRELGRDDGMLFVFPDSQKRYFWMKNTLIPLSIAFMDSGGKILNILEMPPQTEQTFASDGPARFALEMNAGWFERQGLRAGDVIQGVLQAPKAQE
jgi:uncharacterized protein